MLFPQKNYYLKYSLLFYPKAGFQITEGITHFFPFRQQFVKNFSVGLRGAMKQHYCAGMHSGQKLSKRLFFGGLLVFIPVNISEAPKNRFVSKLL